MQKIAPCPSLPSSTALLLFCFALALFPRLNSVAIAADALLPTYRVKQTLDARNALIYSVNLLSTPPRVHDRAALLSPTAPYRTKRPLRDLTHDTLVRISLLALLSLFHCYAACCSMHKQHFSILEHGRGCVIPSRLRCSLSSHISRLFLWGS